MMRRGVENMNAKKNLRNRIHGWLPDNPTVRNASGQATAREPDWKEVKVETAKQRSGHRGVTFMVSYCVLFTFVGFTYIVMTQATYPSSWSFRMTWVIVGAAVGVALGSAVTRRELDILTKTGKYESSSTLRLAFIGACVAVLAVAAFIDLASISVPTALVVVLFSALFAGFPAQMFSRLALVRTWEMKHGAKIYEDQNGLYALLNPKAATTSRTLTNQTVNEEAP